MNKYIICNRKKKTKTNQLQRIQYKQQEFIETPLKCKQWSPYKKFIISLIVLYIYSDIARIQCV